MYRYVLWVSLILSSVFLFSELEVSLLVLPFPYVPDLLKLFNGYVQQGLDVELVCRCLFFLLRYSCVATALTYYSFMLIYVHFTILLLNYTFISIEVIIWFAPD